MPGGNDILPITKSDFLEKLKIAIKSLITELDSMAGSRGLINPINIGGRL